MTKEANNAGLRHEELSDELVDAFMSGDPKYVAKRIRALDYLDGEASDVFCRLIEGDQKLESNFPRRLKFAGWPRVCTASKPLRTPRYAANPLIAALRLGDETSVSLDFRKYQPIEGEVLDALARLFELDLLAKPHFHKCIKFAGWGRGRPRMDEPIKRATHSAIRHTMRALLSEGKSLKQAVHSLKPQFGLGRSTLLKIWNRGRF